MLLTEIAGVGTAGRVDAAAGVIHNVQVLSRFSRNRREYSVGCLQRALPLYRDARIFIDHPDTRNPRGPRSYRDLLGRLRNVHFSGDALRGDLHLNPKHPVVPQILQDAVTCPSCLGLSHNVDAKTEPKNGGMLVTEITKVVSVDVVVDPATNSGLFEDCLATSNFLEAVLEDYGAVDSQSFVRSILETE